MGYGMRIRFVVAQMEKRSDEPRPASHPSHDPGGLVFPGYMQNGTHI